MKKRKKNNKFKCPCCPKSFQSEWDRDRHCRSYHGKRYEELQEIAEASRMRLEDFIKEGDGIEEESN